MSTVDDDGCRFTEPSLRVWTLDLLTGTHTKHICNTRRGGRGDRETRTKGHRRPLGHTHSSLRDCVYCLSLELVYLSLSLSLTPLSFPKRLIILFGIWFHSKSGNYRTLHATYGSLGLFSPITRYSELVTAPQSIAPEPPRTARAPRVPKRAADATRSPISKTVFVPLQRGQSCGAAQRARAIALSRALRACSCAVACAQGRSKWSAIGGSGKWSKGCAGGEAPPLRASRPPSPGAQPLPPPA